MVKTIYHLLLTLTFSIILFMVSVKAFYQYPTFFDLLIITILCYIAVFKED